MYDRKNFNNNNFFFTLYQTEFSLTKKLFNIILESHVTQTRVDVSAWRSVFFDDFSRNQSLFVEILHFGSLNCYVQT